jgi:hypothetical protein
MGDYSRSEGNLTRVWTEDGHYYEERDESFAPVEEEDWEETLRKPRTPARIMRIKRQNELLGGLR